MSANRYPHVAAAVLSVPWAIYPPIMDVVVDVLGRRISGERLSEQEVAERIATGRQAGPRRAASSTAAAGSIRQLGVYGLLAHRADYFVETSTSGTSVQALGLAFRQLVADPEVTGILLDVDSPGGQISGIPELAEEIRAARGTKPIVAIANTLMASAAYWLASQADEIVVTPSSLTGSVGVVMGHEDVSAMLEQDGVKITLIHAGEHKVETWPSVPLTDDAHAHLQHLVDDAYGTFTTAIAKGRGISAADVRANFGGGRVFSPKDAVRAGMADRVDTYENTVNRLAAGKVTSRDDRSRDAASGGVAIMAAGLVTATDLEQLAADAGEDVGTVEPTDRTLEAQAALEIARHRAPTGA